MATVLITGGTGMIGTALTGALLERNYSVIILTRGKTKINNELQSSKVRYASWDIEKQTIDKEAIASTDFIIHLAGTGVGDKRWTTKRKKQIVDSRVKSCELLVKAIREYPNSIKAVVSASAIGWYGPDAVIPNPSPFTEEAAAANDFLGQTCKQWEESIAPVTQSGKRLVRLRTGIVLSKKGGVLDEFKKPLNFGIATILGDGKQMMSWIHIDDLVRLYIAAIENERMNGSYNAVAPSPITNKELVLQLAKSRGGFYIPVPIPSFVLKIILGEMSIEVLKSATVSAQKILQTGFIFSYPSIATALKSLV
ncbi:MAG TPA: TIGR01777 family oxidoreductase [Chitinophagaceae bacterium]